jgi:hypothetical protein
MARKQTKLPKVMPRAKGIITGKPAAELMDRLMDSAGIRASRRKKVTRISGPTPGAQAPQGHVQHVRVVVQKDGSEEITVYGPAPAPVTPGITTSAGGVDSAGMLGGGRALGS